jgi:hypothetical protein
MFKKLKHKKSLKKSLLKPGDKVYSYSSNEEYFINHFFYYEHSLCIATTSSRWNYIEYITDKINGKLLIKKKLNLSSKYIRENYNSTVNSIYRYDGVKSEYDN